MMANILFINNKDERNPASGGGTYLVFRLIRRMIKEGHKVTLLCSNFPGSSRKNHFQGVQVIRIGRSFSMYPLVILEYMFRHRDCDLVVDCSLQGIPFMTPLFVKKPIVAMFFHLEKEVFLIELPLQIKPRMLGIIAGRIAYLIENNIAPLVYRRSTKVTFSESTKLDMIKSGYDKHILVLWEGIFLEKYSSGRRKNPVPLLVYVGRLKKYKGVQDAIMAMNIVVKQFPDARLLIMGRGSFENRLRWLVKEMGLERNIMFLGFVDEAEKIDLLRRAHLLVMPSHREGWATPVIEANACGTPCVVSDAIGVKATVKEGETGLIYPVGNHKEMAERIITMLRNPSLIAFMSANALEWAQRFRWKATEDKFVAIVNRLLDL